MSTLNNKRSLPTDDTPSIDTEPLSKRRKLNETDAIKFMSKLSDISKDNRINDIEFTIKYDGKIEVIHGLKAFFAAHSEVLKTMLYNGKMEESQTNKVIIDDVTIDAFKFIKNYTHLADPELQYEHIVDILYAAEKYMMKELIEDCKEMINEICYIDQFYIILIQINKYSNAFEGLYKDILKLPFIKRNVKTILNDGRSHSLNSTQIQGLVKLIDGRNYGNYDRYNMIKKYCKSIDLEQWKDIFEHHFKDLVNFDKLSINQLVNDVGSDGVLENNRILSLISVKVKEMQTDIDIKREKMRKMKKTNIANIQNKNNVISQQKKQITKLEEMNALLKQENKISGDLEKRIRYTNRKLRIENSRLTRLTQTDSSSSDSSSDSSY